MAFDAKKVWSSSNLPTLPSVAVKLLDLAREPESSIKDYIDTIKTDPAISAKILKSANSTFFGLSTKVTSLERAVPLLGTTVVTSLALSFSLAESTVNGGPLQEHFEQYWRQSLVNATASELLCSHLREGIECEYFLAGLLMDIGRLALMKTAPKDYIPVLTKSSTQQVELHEVELEMLGIGHGEIAVQLLKRWGLPDTISRAAGTQDAPVETIAATRGKPEYSFSVALAVAASVGDYFCSTAKGRALQRLRSLAQELLNFDEAAVDKFLQQVAERMQATAELFSVDIEDIGDISDLMAEASQQLAQLALREHVASTAASEMQRKVEQEKRELETKHEQLQKQALHDPLTQVYNRHFFDETLSKEVQRCCRFATPLGVVFIDVDHFKKLNDTYGHQYGDQVLVRVAQNLKEVCRASDTLARYGGEEFVILASEPTEKGLAKLADRLRARVEAEPFMFGDKPVAVTVSVGAAIGIPTRTDLEIGQRLLASADEAMYDSKRNGRNQVHLRILLSDEDRRLLQQIVQQRFSRWLVARQIVDVATVSKALLQYRPEPTRIGDLAQRQNMLSAAQIERISREQEATSERFGQVAIRLGLLNDAQMISLLVLQQEDPVKLAAILGRMQIIELPRLESLLQEYLALNPCLAPVPQPAK